MDEGYPSDHKLEYGIRDVYTMSTYLGRGIQEGEESSKKIICRE